MNITVTVTAMTNAGCTAEQISDVLRELKILLRDSRRVYNSRYYSKIKALRCANSETLKRTEPSGKKVSNGFPMKSSNPSLPSQNHQIPINGRARARQIEPEAQPTPNDRAAASKTGLSEADFGEVWSHFRDHHISKGSLMLDWAAAWRTWLARSKQFGRGHASGINAVPWQNRRDVGLSGDDKIRLMDQMDAREAASAELDRQNGISRSRDSEFTYGVFQAVQPRAALPNGRG